MNKSARMYDSVRWRKARAVFLRAYPLCVLCLRSVPERITSATILDHIRPHNEDYELFWDRDNWQGLCASCHSGIKRVQDTYGHSQACGVDGLPLDSSGHPWGKIG